MTKVILPIEAKDTIIKTMQQYQKLLEGYK